MTRANLFFILLSKFFFAGVEFVVSALLGEEIIVRTTLYNFTLLKHHYRVGVTDGGKAVGYYEGCSILHKSIHTVLYVALGTGINGAGRFVKDEYRCFGKRGSRDI